MGGLFGKVFAAACRLTFDQMCSGTIGTHMPSMFALGLLQMNATVRSSTASTFSMTDRVAGVGGELVLR